MTEGEKTFFTHYIEYIDQRLHRFFVKLVGAFAVVFITMALAFAYIAHVSAQNQAGLCALRADAQARIDQTAEFLKENPHGIPGISAEQLKRSTANSVRTRDALENLSCPL